ncbi:lysoplasmalogenase [Arenibacter sp. H213]|uniref:Lysoplasmalogenase n=1 Tax=Arenibacter antarcticus TaxID=2040469 RepID=A0ABW5VEC4_9FLAO|nr:lysoplasmalogenase [Arenibacter sp. H213]MCM4168316.1 lysoplasmalogenase [Arenibacter sp. H213]
MSFKSISFLLGYIIIVCIDLLCGYLDYQEYRLLTKPLIVISLMIYFGIKGKHLPKSIYEYTVLAMFFSLVGDTLLLFDNRSPSFFMFGLMSFLLAHIGYTIVFIKQRNTKYSKVSWIVSIGLVTYGIALFSLIIKDLRGLMIPVSIYIIAILTMAITSQNRMGNVSRQSYILVLLGAFFFIISDSILAIDKFHVSVPKAHFLIMGTYAISQYLIVNGLLASIDQNIKEN